MSVLPTSMEIDTGISRITSRFGPSRLTGSLFFGTLPNSSIGKRLDAELPESAASKASMSACPASPVSSRAAAHSSARAWSSCMFILSVSSASKNSEFG
ncbi:hypothetical protein D3C86_1861980 [compost metagenome]